MQHDKIFESSITLSCTPTIVADMLATLRERPSREAIFRKTYTYRWLDIPVGVEGDPLILQYVFCHEVVTDPRSEVEEMVL